MSFSRKLARRQAAARQEEKARTRAGLCARCGAALTAHQPLPDLKCPDGLGSFTWAMDRAATRRAIERLEELQREVNRRQKARADYSDDARVLLDRFVELSGARVESVAIDALSPGAGGFDRGRGVTTSELASDLGWTQDRVRIAIVELREQGCLEGEPENLS